MYEDLNIPEEPGVVARECRFATYSKSQDPSNKNDIHFIKEQVHYADGSIKPNTRIIRNFQRPFWVTKKGKRNHQDKREWAPVDELDKFMTTQTKMADNVGRALGKSWMTGGMRDLSSDPYLYGSDISSTSIIKQYYKDKFDKTTPARVAVFDTETDVVHDTGQIMMATVSFKERVFTAVQKSFVAAYPNAIEKIHQLAELYLGDVFKERNITLEVVIVPDEIAVIKACMIKGHEWKPDYMSVWNVSFDMDKMIEACDRAGENIADILCDPQIPPEYRSFNFKKGPPNKKTASGKVMNFKPHQRWHSVTAPASFTWIDAMCVYRAVRMGEPEEPKYKLDYMLKKHLEGRGKLKFSAAEHLEDQELEWHKFMQSQYPLEYVVYNIFDCVGMEMLDEKTLDCQLSLPMNAGCTDMDRFNSQPRRTVNELHWFVQKHNHIIGSTGSEMATELDNDTMDLSDWIVMLPAHMVADNGLCIVVEGELIRTNIRVHVGDLDVAASYPNGECVFNISKKTTSKELISIEGVDEVVQRMAGINLSAGITNASEICVNAFGTPTFDQWLEAFQQEHPTELVEVNNLFIPADEVRVPEQIT